MAESFSRQKSRHAPQKEGGLKILCDIGCKYTAHAWYLTGFAVFNVLTRETIHSFFRHIMPVAPVAQRYHVTSETLGREFDPGKRDFSH